MNWKFWRRESVSPPLVDVQLRWLAGLLLLAQAPHWMHLPAWVAGTGMVLVAARFAVPQRRPLSRWLLAALAVAIGVGIRLQFGNLFAREPSVAFLYILVGIKFLESRHARDGSLLICLALFLVLTSFCYGQSLPAALATLPALLAFGGALAALRSAPPAGADWKAPLLGTARMLVEGIPLAAIMFVLFPRLASPLWGMPADMYGRSGLSDRMAPGLISQLSLSDAVAFRVDFEGPPPPPAQRYWRGPVFSRFDGREWSAPPRMLRRGQIAPVTGRPIRYNVTLEPSDKLWLFALELPASLPQPPVGTEAGQTRGSELALLTNDQQLIARAPPVQALRYEQQSVLRDRYPSTRASDTTENLKLPDNNPQTRALAQEMRAHSASDSDYIHAVLQRFHDEPFAYTLEPTIPPPQFDNDAIDGFLFDTRSGFCEHYAASFVVLMRAAGIPARVVTGYQGGEINPSGDYLIVRQSDAHAWAEVLLDGEWRRFDPTAAVAPSRIERGLGAAMPLDDQVPYLARIDMTWLKSLRLHWDAVNYQWQRGVVGFNTDRQRGLIRELGLEGATHWQFVALIAVAAALWGAVLLALSRRTQRGDPEVTLWDRACRRLASAGLKRRPDEGPLAYMQRAGERWPQWRELLARLGQSYAQLRYGRDDGLRARRIAEFRAELAALPPARALAQRDA